METQQFKRIIDNLAIQMKQAYNKGNYKQIVVVLNDALNEFNIETNRSMSDDYIIKSIQAIEKCAETSEQLEYLYSNIFILLLPYLSDDDKKIDRFQKITREDLKFDSYMQVSFQAFMGDFIKSLSDDKKRLNN